MADNKKRGYLFFSLAGLLVLLIAAIVVLGYVAVGRNAYNEPCDGFGRMLDELPPALGYVLPQWAGIVWFVLDCVAVIFSVIGIENLIIRGRAVMRPEE